MNAQPSSPAPGAAPSAPADKQGLRRRVRRSLAELALTLPSCGWMIVFFLIPSILLFTLSFHPTATDGGIGEGWTLETWRTLANPDYPSIVWRTIWLSAVSTFVCLAISVPCAYAMARAPEVRRHVLVGLVILPFWTSFLIRVFAWKILLHPDGVIRGVLLNLSIIRPDQQLLYNPVAVLLVMIYTYLPFAMLPLYAAAEKFDFNLVEAALDLGATPRRAFAKVFVPGIRAGLFSAMLMVLIPAFGSYVIPDMVGGANSEMIGTKIAQRAIPDRNLPHASALAALLMLGVLIPPAIGWMVLRRRNIGATETEAVAAARPRIVDKGGVA
ncbi:MAG: ABC transporter permease [Kiritimatiellia bacterium]|jgi:spermidine/putrescine transport system permease protein